MATDRQLIDALCRARSGWSPDVPGDREDYQAASELIFDHAETVRGTFAPTSERQLRMALEDLVGGIKSLKLDTKLPGPFARAEAALNSARATGEA